jgi:phosphoglycolate phosphatase
LVYRYATLCLKKNPGCLFIATNLDSVSNVSETQEWPAGGCMVGAVKAATNVEPVVVGKPSTFMMDYIANK